MNTFYDILEIHPKASPEVVAAAYKAMMRLHHPDQTTTTGRTARKINEAYEVLADPAKRADYDRSNHPTGKIVGDFRIESPIAEGGFGKTYKGSHLLTGSPVCIKHCSQISPVDAAILIEETQAMWDLRHYAIPAARTLLRLDDGSLALVMSYIPGPTLAEVVETYAKRGDKLEPEDVAWMMDRILNALSYIHRHGVVHGDLKPQNIIIQPESHMVVLVDFGLAAVKPTRTTNNKGYTDLFAPPEQVKGSPLLPQTDFFSLGMTALYALTGGDEDRVRGKQVPSSVPTPLCNFIRRLLVKHPLHRPDWATEDLMESFSEVRRKSFGRGTSGMKPLTL